MRTPPPEITKAPAAGCVLVPASQCVREDDSHPARRLTRQHNGEGRQGPALQPNVGKDLESRGRQMNEEGPRGAMRSSLCFHTSGVSACWKKNGLSSTV